MRFLPIRGPRLAQRLVRLIVGLILFGVGSGLMLQSTLGLSPWDVLHQGLTVQLGLSVGTWTVIVSFVVLALWLPLREPYGLGTLLNALIIGPSIDATTALVAEPEALVLRILLMTGGVVVVAIATGLYIGAQFGPGPRDGLMTGIARRGPSIRLTRAAIEISVLLVGWLLGGTVGVGTVFFALAIGPLVQYFLPLLTVEVPGSTLPSG